MKKTITIAGCLFIIERQTVLHSRNGFIVRNVETHEPVFIDSETLNDSQR